MSGLIEQLGGGASERRRPGRLPERLAASLAFWLAVSPFAQLAHLAFADHEHRYCVEHGYFEDVPRSSPDLAATRATDGPAMQRGEASATRPLAHRICGVLSQGAARAAWATNSEAAAVTAAAALPELGPQRRVTSCFLPLVAAPKTSPPFFPV